MAFKQSSQKGRGETNVSHVLYNSGPVFMSPKNVAQLYVNGVDLQANGRDWLSCCASEAKESRENHGL